MQQNIAWFYISMHNVGLNQYLKSLQQIFKVVDSFFFGKPTHGLNFLLESTSVAVLIDEVVVVGCFKYFYESDDVSGVFDFREGLDFVDGELFQFGTHFELLNTNDFDSDDLVGLVVDGFVDFAEFALADDGVQHVVFDLLAHWQLLIIDNNNL